MKERLARLLRALVILSASIPGAIAPTIVCAAGSLVSYPSPVEPGTIVIRTTQRSLYFILNEGSAIRYPIAVPKSGHEWSGRAAINGKYVDPDWSPPPCVKADHPELPNFIPGGAPGNPMGARAITLDREQVAIHGTTQKMRRSIGTAASYGCIRMRNEDVIDLFERVQIGTPVILTR
jgi:lipoprotein-anchoring transpeptidase ErfK/SrfK